MSEKIFNLFGEEIVPEPAKNTIKTKPVTTKDDKKEGNDSEFETLPPEAAVNTATGSTIAISPTPADTPKIVFEKEKSSPDTLILPETNELTKTESPEDKVELPVAGFELPEDWKGDKQYYTIGEVATLFQVKTSHIRFWTNEFNIKVRTTRKGDRLYTSEQIHELKAINQLVKERGYTINGAKTKLKATKKIDVTSFNLKLALQQLKTDLLTIRNQL